MRGSTAPFYLLYQTGLAPTNGTSVQLIRLLEGIEESAIHLLWDVREGGATSVQQSLVLDDNYTGPLEASDANTGSRTLDSAKWWSGTSLNERRLRDALRRFLSQPARAWVFCGNERDASRATAILKALDHPPFLLHMMDIFHNRISPTLTPQLFGLVKAASQIVCTSAMAAMEVHRHRPGEIHVLPCCSSFSAGDRRSWKGGSLRIAMTGALWDKSMWNNSPALDLFAAAWPQIKQRLPGIEVHYAGGFAEHLPSSFANEVRNHGYLEPAQCEQLLRNCHLAYLPVSLSTHFGPYSVPSRLADYLACGLPTITCTSPGTGIFSFVQMVPRDTVINVKHTDELVNAIDYLTAEPARWRRLSAEAAAYAENVLHADRIRCQLLAYLDRCDARHVPSATVE
jgi:glycosyltransferase involved in cell wall biosynthesis